MPRHLILASSAVLLFSTGCATPQHPGASPDALTRWESNALAQGCGHAGLPAWRVRDAWGKPDSLVPTGEGVATWVYLRSHVRLRLSFVDEVLDSWEVRGLVSAKLARVEPAWSLNQRRGFPQRVTTYLKNQFDQPPTLVYAMYRACPQPGMSEAELVASWGEPSDRLREANGSRMVLRYGFGVEGQHDRLVFEGDSLVGFSEGGRSF